MFKVNKKVAGLVCLAAFAMLQISACFVAAAHTEGFVSFFYYVLGGVTCLFGVVLDFLLLIMSVDIFGSTFGALASSITKKTDEDEETEEGEE